MRTLPYWTAWVAALFLAVDLFPHTVAMRLLLLVGGVALAVIGMGLRKARAAGTEVDLVPPLLLPFALWATWAALSLLWSTEPARSLKEFKNEIGYVLLAFWMCYIAAQHRAAPRIFAGVVGVGALLACAVVLYFFWFPAPWVLRLGLHNGPGDQTSALLTLMPCALVGAWLAAKRKMRRSVRLASIALPVVFVASAYATLNRTVWLGFAAEVLLLGVLLRNQLGFVEQRRTGSGRWWVVVVALVVVGAGVGTMLYMQRDRTEHGWARPLTGDLRLKLWPDVVRSIKERPLTGYGFGRGMIRHSLFRELDNHALWNAHNLVLSVAVQLGLPGVALLLVLLYATARAGWRLARSSDPVTAACGAALVAVVCGMFIRNMTDMLWARQNALLYWGVVGALLAWGRGGSAAHYSPAAAARGPGAVPAPGA